MRELENESGSDRGEPSGLPFYLWVTEYLDGQIGPADLELLNAELRADPRRRALFAELCFLRASLIRSGISANATNRLDAAEPAVDRALDDVVIMTALRDAEPAVEQGPAPLRLPQPPAPAPQRRQWPAKRMRWLGSTAAALALVGTLVWALWPTRPAAVVTAVADAGSTLPAPQSPVAAGQALHLDAGAVELRFKSGAVVVVRAPAQIRVVDGNTLALDAGELTAHVPLPARGFCVNAPGLRVVDLGTDFGIRTEPGGTAADVHVFGGRVSVTGLDAGGKASADPVVLTAGQAVRHDQANGNATPTAVRYAMIGFDRDIDALRLPVPAHRTGNGLPAGSVDPFWQITSTPDTLERSSSQPTYVVGLGTGTMAGNYRADPDGTQWISNTREMSDALVGQFVFHTTVDLTGFEPTSVRASAAVRPDDELVDIRINGQGLANPTATTKGGDVPLPGPWHEGINQVDVVVLNTPSPSPTAPPNLVGLKLAWKITATPLVRREGRP